MKKPSLTTITGILTGTAIGLVGLYLFNNPSTASNCKSNQNASSHKVVIRDGEVTPEFTTAQRCDTLIITNADSKAREIAFGAKDKHINYAGTTEKVLNEGRSMTITLSQTGSYHFHDHLDETIGGEVTIK